MMKLISKINAWWDRIFDKMFGDKISVVKRSIKCAPLVEIHESGGGVCIRRTKEGNKGAMVIINCTQFHEFKYVIAVLRGEYDLYISDESKMMVVDMFKSLDNYYQFKHTKDPKGHLVFHREPWSRNQISTIHNWYKENYDN